MRFLSQPPTLAGWQCQFLQMREFTLLGHLIDVLLSACEAGVFLSDHLSSHLWLPSGFRLTPACSTL